MSVLYQATPEMALALAAILLTLNYWGINVSDFKKVSLVGFPVHLVAIVTTVLCINFGIYLPLVSLYKSWFG